MRQRMRATWSRESNSGIEREGLGFSKYGSAMISFLVLLLVSFSTGSAAADEARIQKLCIFESARYLPAVPGLIIVASRAEARAGGKSFAVEIDIKATGQEATYRFVCGSSDGRTAIIQEVGLK
jgi:hypothetical protein